MDPATLQSDDWKLLLTQRSETCVSLYMPTHRSGAEVQQDPVRLKNLLREADGRLQTAGLKPREAADLLAPAEHLTSEALAWQRRSDGLALYMAPGLFRALHLPLAFDERVVLGERFHVRPLVPLLMTDDRFYVLALSLHQVRLLAATRRRARRVALRGVPESLEEVLGSPQFATGVQLHSARSRGPGRQTAIFHGHDGEQEKLKREVLHYFQLVARGLPDNLADRHAPVVLAAVEEHFPLFREANRGLVIVDGGVAGNPEHRSDHELQQQAWEVAEPWLLRRRDEALARYDELRGSPRTSSDLKELVSGAHQGRVDTLFVTDDQGSWGAFDPQTGQVTLHASRRDGDEDLIDTATFYTLSRGGTVYAVAAEDLSDGAPAAAVFRY